MVNRLTASIFETGDKRIPTDKLAVRNNNLEHFTQKLDMPHLKEEKERKWQ